MRENLHTLADSVTENKDDHQFLCRMMARYPRVEQGFRQFLATRPSERISLALDVVNVQPRTGWLRFLYAADAPTGLDVLSDSWRPYLLDIAPRAPETVLQHCIEAAELYTRLYPGAPELGAQVLRYHDLAEAIIGDFTPHDGISKADKARLEGLAIEVLTAHRHQGAPGALHVYNCLQVYEGNKTDYAAMRAEFLAQPNLPPTLAAFYAPEAMDMDTLSARTHDIDSVHMVVRGTRMMRDKHSTLPEEKATQLMEEFWTYVDKKIVTPEARGFYDSLRPLYLNEPGLSYQDCMTRALPRPAAAINPPRAALSGKTRKL